MSWSTLRPQIGTLLSSLTSGGNTIIQEVSNTPKLKFSGYPAAYVVPSDLESEYETTIENERVYAFIVRLFHETKETGIGDAIAALEDVVDSVIDAIDQEDKKAAASRTIGISLPSDYVFLAIAATPGMWAELPSEQLIMSEVRLRVRISYDAS